MARTAIFLTLIAATLIGPCLCCCALGLSPRSVTEPQTATAAPPACPHCRPPAPEPAPPAEPCHDCPICAKRIVPAVVAEVPVPLLAIDLAFAAYLPVEPDLANAGPESAAQGVVVQDLRTFLIDVCHRLRC
jgi:hypothetical protein